jgi:hypothetical protein
MTLRLIPIGDVVEAGVDANAVAIEPVLWASAS